MLSTRWILEALERDSKRRFPNGSSLVSVPPIFDKGAVSGKKKLAQAVTPPPPHTPHIMTYIRTYTPASIGLAKEHDCP